MEKINGKKFDKLLKLLDEEEFYVNDFLALTCAQLCDLKNDTYTTGLKVGGKFFEISIKRRELQ